MEPSIQNDSFNNNSRLKVLLVILSLLLLLTFVGIFFIARYTFMLKNITPTPSQSSTVVGGVNSKIVYFERLFLEKVIKARTEINFETRVELENAVKDIGDPQISAAWKLFVESRTEVEAQERTRELLTMLVNKTKVN